MDPLLLEALRFGVAIIAGGIVAVIAQRIAFDHARQLQREDSRRQDQRLRDALVAEVRENLRRLRGPVVTEASSATVVRSAWDAARGLDLGVEVFDVLALAYASGAELDRMATFGLGRMMYGGIAMKGFPEDRARQELKKVTTAATQQTYDAFAKALQLLEATAADKQVASDG